MGDHSMNAKDWIDALSLSAHPEGGYYRETYRAEQRVSVLGEVSVERTACTFIYFLLEGQQLSRFHRVRFDEMWHFCTGSSLTIHVLEEASGYQKYHLGLHESENKETIFQLVVRAGLWFAVEVDDKASYSLVGCTVAPSFEFEDFELAEKEKLYKLFPSQKELIERFT